MKRNVLAAFLGLWVLFLTACGTAPTVQTTQEKPTSSQDTEEIPEEKYRYDLSEYVRSADPLKISAVFEDPTVCTDEEWEEAVFQVLLSNASFTEKTGAAEQYNKVEFDFTLSYEGELQEGYSQKGFSLILGDASNPDLEALLAEALLGALPGEERSVDYTYPDTVSYGSWRGKTVRANAKVVKVYQHKIPECNDEFAKGLEGLGFQTAAEFRESVRKDILKSKEQKRITAVWLEFKKTVEILKYPEKEWNSYVQDYREYYEYLAKSNNISLENYLKVYLGTDLEGFQKEAEEYAKELCGNELAYSHLVKVLGITLSEAEYREGLQQYFEESEGSFASPEECEKYYGEKVIRQYLSWDKALITMAEAATRLEGEGA